MLSISKYNCFFASILSLIFAVGILSFAHYPPSEQGLSVQLQMAVIAGIALIILSILSGFNKLSLSSALYAYLAILLACQPLLHHMNYPYIMIFPVGACLIFMLVAIIVNNLQDKNQFSSYLSFFLSIVIFLHSLSLIAQLLHLSNLYNVLIFYNGSTRIMGNIAQPNQAAFIISLGIMLTVHLYAINPSKNTKPIYLALVLLILIYYFLCLALTDSRTGIILGFSTIFIYAILYTSQRKNKILLPSIFIIAALIGYFLGVIIAQFYGIDNPLDKLHHSNTLFTRIDSSLDAWHFFTKNIFSGVGMFNLTEYRLNHFDGVLMASAYQNSHFFITQISAEFGVLGLIILIPIIYIILANIFTDMEQYQRFAISLIALSLIYSFSEYPLWYTQYGFIFAICLGLLKQPCLTIKYYPHRLKYLSFIIALTISIFSIYYSSQYKQYRDFSIDTLPSKTISDSDKLKTVSSLPDIKAFRHLKDKLYFDAITQYSPASPSTLEMGKRVVELFPKTDRLLKQALLLGFNQQPEQSLAYFKYLCRFNHDQYCEYFTNILSKINAQYPAYFNTIFTEFIQWKVNYFNKQRYL